jgi:hypothetical protein
MTTKNYCWTKVAVFSNVPLIGALVGLTSLFLSNSAMSLPLCPAFGNDSDCGTVITITGSGSSVSFTGQGPYDGIEDTLVGVVNNSSYTINSINLSSGFTIGGLTFGGQNIFGFDGDGINTYGAPGNSKDSTGYGGPNTYFANVNSNQTQGKANFVTGLAPGTSTYFSLENALSNSSACPDILNGALTSPFLAGGSRGNGNPTTIQAFFTPNFGLTLQQAAAACGFTNFDWVQTIKYIPGIQPIFQSGGQQLTSSSTPFNDPISGGYTYCVPMFGYPCDGFPYYYGVNDPSANPFSLAHNETVNTLSFYDGPSDPCLLDSNGQTSPVWNNVNNAVYGPTGAPVPIQSVCPLSQLASGYLDFNTSLVGVLPSGTPQDLGMGFKWLDDFNGTSGGISTFLNDLPTDDGSGVGGITVISFSGFTNYQGGPATSISVTGLTQTVPEPPEIAIFSIGGLLLALHRLQWSGNFRRLIGLLSLRSIQGCRYGAMTIDRNA